MILVGSQRSRAYNLANHLMNDFENDHVTLFDVRGFVARDLHGALPEAWSPYYQKQKFNFCCSRSTLDVCWAFKLGITIAKPAIGGRLYSPIIQ